MAEQGPASDPRIAALRAQGAQQVDPVRFRYLEALARRAAAHGGEVRQLLDEKLAQALMVYGVQVEQALGDAGQTPRATQPRPGPLAELVRHLERPRSGMTDGAAIPAEASPAGPPAELKALQDFRSTWARLSVDRQLARSLAEVPRNPGPLNSHHLALRALQLMQTLSPAYLQRFLSQVEALLWLEQASLGGAPLPGRAVRREGDKPRKSGRGKSG